MPTKKIADFPKQLTCTHPEHNPPSMRVFTPGVYEHTCPACGKVTRFTVEPNTCEKAEGELLWPPRRYRRALYTS